MRGRRVIINYGVFRALWKANWAAVSIARALQISQPTILKYAQSQALPARNKKKVMAVSRQFQWDGLPIDVQAKRVLGYALPEPVFAPTEASRNNSKPEPDTDGGFDQPKHKVSDAGGRWSKSKDKSILSTGGRYAEVATLADRWGLGTATIMARYHILRPRMPRP